MQAPPRANPKYRAQGIRLWARSFQTAWLASSGRRGSGQPERRAGGARESLSFRPEGQRHPSIRKAQLYGRPYKWTAAAAASCSRRPSPDVDLSGPACAESSRILWGQSTPLDALRVFQGCRHYPVGKFQGAAASSTIDQRRAAGADALKESTQFGVQWLFWRSGHLLESNLRLRTARFHAHTQHILPRKIKRDILVLLKEPHFADALGRDAAGSKIRDRPIFKFDARVGDVHFVSHYRYSHSFQIDNRRVYERQNDVQIVDHHVVNHVNVQAARCENSEPVNLEKHRARDDLLHSGNGWIEPFQVTHLKNAMVPRGSRD